MTADELIDDILKAEAGYVNHPADKGGPTKYGITRATLARYRRRPVTTEDVKLLHVDEARAIYRSEYLTKPRVDQLPDAVRAVIFDMGVNIGPSAAVKVLQYVLAMAGFGPVRVDGVIGPTTIEAAEMAAAEMGGYLVNSIVDERRYFYRQLVARDRTQAAFIKGWLNRVQKFEVAL